MDLALNNLQKLICHKTQPTNQPTKPGIFATHGLPVILIVTEVDVFMLSKHIYSNQKCVSKKWTSKIYVDSPPRLNRIFPAVTGGFTACLLNVYI